MTDYTDSLPFIDSHAHLDGIQFAEDREAVIHRAYEQGVRNILTIGTGLKSSHDAITLAERYPFIYAAVGIDPHGAWEHNPQTWSEIVAITKQPRVRALGETGLDFHYYNSPKSDQIRSFKAHIRLSSAVNLPLVIHNRESDADLLQIIDEEDPRHQLTVIMHSFCGSPDFGRKCLERGFFISLSGMVTFKSMKWLADFARTVPLDKLLVETDCPYLAPVPVRGNRNEPAFVIHTTDYLASLRGLTREDILQILNSNFSRLFLTR